MPDWLQAILSFLTGSGVLIGIGKWFQWRREDRLARELAAATQAKEHHREIFDIQQERIKDALDRSDGTMRIAKALEQIVDQLAERQRQIAELRQLIVEIQQQLALLLSSSRRAS